MRKTNANSIRLASSELVFATFATSKFICGSNCIHDSISIELIDNFVLEFFFLSVIFRAGLIYYEYSRIRQRLNQMISPFVINFESKHPDYIYIKYHIYRESMQQKKNAELQNKVTKFLLQTI